MTYSATPCAGCLNHASWLFVPYKVKGNSRKRSYASINGKFDKIFEQFNACFDTLDYGQAHIRLIRE